MCLLTSDVQCTITSHCESPLEVKLLAISFLPEDIWLWQAISCTRQAGVSQDLHTKAVRDASQDWGSWSQTHIDAMYDEVKHFPHYKPFVRGNDQLLAVSLTKGQLCWPLMFALLSAWTSCWTKSCVPMIWDIMMLMWCHCRLHCRFAIFNKRFGSNKETSLHPEWHQQLESWFLTEYTDLLILHNQYNGYYVCRP